MRVYVAYESVIFGLCSWAEQASSGTWLNQQKWKKPAPGNGPDPTSLFTCTMNTFRGTLNKLNEPSLVGRKHRFSEVTTAPLLGQQQFEKRQQRVFGVACYIVKTSASVDHEKTPKSHEPHFVFKGTGAVYCIFIRNSLELPSWLPS